MIFIECPKFLGGAKELIGKSRVGIAKDSVNEEANQLHIDGIFFRNAPDTLDPIERENGNKLHIVSEEFDLLVDAYLDLEDRTGKKQDLEHYVTLRDGLLTIEAVSNGQSGIVIEVSCAVPRQDFRRGRTTTSRDQYLREWRGVMGELHRAIAGGVATG